ncbi:methyl-accepting chemotaxis protein [Loktanella sp. R86503]|uniref:methyl-accepting chemotaxis protein n=1 Tax=Loktanella sp. R86503 TaxID=3093847 RepID=UPI0036DB7A48
MTAHPSPLPAGPVDPDGGGADNHRLNRLISGLGSEIVNIAAFLDDLHQTAGEQLQMLADSQTALASLNQTCDTMGRTTALLTTSAKASLDGVDASVATLRASAETSKGVSRWVTDFEDRIAQVRDSLEAVAAANTQIADIAVHVNILAINARIEAARAGDAGRGFAVVADAIKALSHKTTAAADTVTQQTKHLTQTFETLHSESQNMATDARAVIAAATATDNALMDIASSIRATTEQSGQIAAQAAQVDAATKDFVPAFHRLSRLAGETGDGVTQATNRSTALIARSEAIVQAAALIGGTSIDTPFIDFVQTAAKRITAIWEEAIATGRISLRDLFDCDYTPLPGTNPQQFCTRFTAFTDRTLPAVQEPALQLDRRVVFCAAIDQHGYLPTHNAKFSQPPSSDPVWNGAHCRNRRIFDDRVGLKSGRSTAPFLLQVYRRDMGGGQFVMMKDVSAPITVQGKHWGGLRLAYTFD